MLTKLALLAAGLEVPKDPELKTLRAALTEARVKPAARAETLSLEESAAVFLALRDHHEGS